MVSPSSFSSRDQVTALEGVAGAGKTTSLVAIREAAEREGYKVEGFAPTSRAAQKLGEAEMGGLHPGGKPATFYSSHRCL